MRIKTMGLKIPKLYGKVGNVEVGGGVRHGGDEKNGGKGRERMVKIKKRQM